MVSRIGVGLAGLCLALCSASPASAAEGASPAAVRAYGCATNVDQAASVDSLTCTTPSPTLLTYTGESVFPPNAYPDATGCVVIMLYKIDYGAAGDKRQMATAPCLDQARSGGVVEVVPQTFACRPGAYGTSQVYVNVYFGNQAYPIGVGFTSATEAVSCPAA